MIAVAQGVVVLAGAWLILLGLFMAVAPRRALSALRAMGGTPQVHFGEMALRTAIGLALVVAAPVSRFPTAVAVIGAFLIVSALVLMLLPRRWHAAYSRWWADRIPVLAVRLIAPASILAGAALIACILRV